MKRFLSFALTLVMLFSLWGCAGAQKQEVSIYDRGLEVAELMVLAVRSEEYLAALSASDALTEQLDGVAAGDYTGPRAVYSITFPESALGEMMAFTDLENVPEKLAELLNHRLTAAVMSQINAMAGVEALAASSLCTVGKTFVSTQLEKDAIYLYVYENGFPVAVTFTGGEDQTVSASGVFVMVEDFPTDSAEQISEFLGGFARVEKIG